MRLSPFDPYSFLFSLARGYAHFLQHQLPEAVAWLSKAAQQNPRFHPIFLFLGSALAYAGRMEEARAAIRRLLELHPAHSVTWLRQHLLQSGADFEYVVEGARLVGLPEWQSSAALPPSYPQTSRATRG
jgi:adenylate cyclase